MNNNHIANVNEWNDATDIVVVGSGGVGLMAASLQPEQERK